MYILFISPPYPGGGGDEKNSKRMNIHAINLRKKLMVVGGKYTPLTCNDLFYHKTLYKKKSGKTKGKILQNKLTNLT